MIAAVHQLGPKGVFCRWGMNIVIFYSPFGVMELEQASVVLCSVN